MEYLIAGNEPTILDPASLEDEPGGTCDHLVYCWICCWAAIWFAIS
jgi:hypothetical protein